MLHRVTRGTAAVAHSGLRIGRTRGRGAQQQQYHFLPQQQQWQPRRPSLASYSSSAREHALSFFPGLQKGGRIKGGGAFTARELRSAYFEESKRLHPDVSSLDKAAATKLFLEMTTAYETLLAAPYQRRGRRRRKKKSSGNANDDADDADDDDDAYDDGDDDGDDDLYMSEREEAEWRRNCELWVGVGAELVEELKADPAFREWLMLPEPDAEHWRLFLFSHGGLAAFPLRPQLATGGGGGGSGDGGGGGTMGGTGAGGAPLMIGKRPRRKRKP